MGIFQCFSTTCFPGFSSRLAALLLVSALLIPGASASRGQQAPAADPLNQHYSAAQTFQLGGDFERAETEYHQVLALASATHGRSYGRREERFGEAVRLLEDAVAADPTYADARIDLAMAYFRAGHLDQASAQAAEVVKNDPHNVRALQLLGNVEFAQGNFAEAAEHLHTALGLQGDFDTAYSLALAYLSQHKLAETKILFDETAERHGLDPGAPCSPRAGVS